MTATYRLQLHAGFTFEQARAIVPYLAELGITHLYLSPILQAAPGSTHGYDVVDSNHVNGELGGEAGFQALVADVRAAGLKILLDIVPNHMSIAGTSNAWWMDVLENGPASYYAHFFDVDWSAGDDRVTLPVLGERYGRALAAGHLAVTYDEHGFAIRANDARYPIAPESLGRIVRRAGERARLPELGFIGDALAALPRETTPDARRRRHRDKSVLGTRLAQLAAEPATAEAIKAEVAAVNADRVELDAVLEAQPYRLVHWTVSSSELTYRRFFNINTLVGLRVEELDVFEERHARVMGWLRDGTIDGVRIDHVDGLRDPGGYLIRLRERAPEAWIVVEKILGDGERLPPWPIDGTTGYEFGERIGSALPDPAGEAALTETFEAYTGTTFDAKAVSRASRRDVMSDALHSEVTRLVEIAARACSQSAATRDFTRSEVEHAIIEIIAGYPVYRTYLGGSQLAGSPAAPADVAAGLRATDLHVVAERAASAPTGEPRSQRELDRARIGTAAHAANEAGVDPDLISFLELALAGEIANARDLAIAAQQVTGAIVAKGDEDTASYRLVRLASRCEVGADLGKLSRSPSEVHHALATSPPRGLLATATHDTKRGEDVRARISVLSEQPAAWRTFVEAARERGDRYWGDVAPDRTFEYLMWQTFVGAWPLEPERATEYAKKAAREARLRTSWLAPDEEFEAAMLRWVTSTLADPDLRTQITAFVAQLAPRAIANSLAQLLVKLTAPGVPDIYQGCELADGSLVDPDNRRPVDYDVRKQALRSLSDLRVADVAHELGLAKLWTIKRTLQLRRERPELFAAPYAAMQAHGPRADRVFAFARGEDLIVAVPRAGAVDPETVIALPAGTWRDVLADLDHGSGTVAASGLWAAFPVALLVRS